MRRLLLTAAPLALIACASPTSAPANEAPASAAAADAARPADGTAVEAAREQAVEEEVADADEMGAAPGGGAAPARAAPSEPSIAGEMMDERAKGDAPEDDVRVPMINGGLDRDIIRRVAKDHASDVQGCVPKSLAQNAALSELLSIELRIDAKGEVSQAEASEDSPFTLSEVERCVLELAKGWSFPPADSGEDTSVTLQLQLGG